MASAARVIWQVSGGPASRCYADTFLRHGVALIGPGDAGPWRPGRPQADFDGPFVGRLATEMKLGDALVLRTGASSIVAVGLIAGDYEFLPQFDDVNGWDLQHGRRVRWCRLPDAYDFGTRVFGANPSRLGRVAQAAVVDYVHRFLASPPSEWQHAPLPGLPSEEPPIRDIPEPLRELVAQVEDLARLYEDPEAFGDRPLEDELVGHYVVPFLRALGWPPERIAVKWRWVDVAAFTSLPRSPESCAFIVEAKRLGAGVEGALGQGQRYLKDLGITRDIVVTDGIRYRLYAGDLGFLPAGYANLLRLKQSADGLFARLRRP